MSLRIKDCCINELMSKAQPVDEYGQALLFKTRLTDGEASNLAQHLCELTINDMELKRYLEENEVSVSTMVTDDGEMVFSIDYCDELVELIRSFMLSIDTNDNYSIVISPERLYCCQYSNIGALLNTFPTEVANLFRQGKLELNEPEPNYEEELRGSDEEVAFKLLNTRNPSDNPNIYSDLATSYERGMGVEQSYKMAKELYLKAIDLGSAHARVNLALLYLQGKGVKKIVNRAICLLTEAAIMQEPDAIEILAALYFDGDYVKENKYLSYSYAFMGAGLGSESCKELMAEFYERGEVVKRNLDGAIFYYEALSPNNPKRYLGLGRIYAYNQAYSISIPDCIDMLERALELGEIDAALELSKLYGRAGEYQNLDKALAYLDMYNKAS